MSPRRSFERHATPHSFDAAVDQGDMARAQGVILAAAGALGYAGVLLDPPASGLDELLLTAIQVAAFLTGGLLMWFGARVPRWALRLNPPVSTVLTSCAVYLSGDVTSGYAFFYIWPCIFAFYFFSWREAMLNVVNVCLNYAVVIAVMDGSGSGLATGVPHHFVMTVGTLVVAGASLLALRSRVDKLFARLTDAARTDALTGLPNRVAFHEAVEREVDRAAPAQRPVSVLVIDLDRFKQVNERYGIAAGDQIVQSVGAFLQKETRLIDFVARTGGEEFAVILPEWDQHNAFLMAEELLGRLREEFSAPRVEITASIGLASYPEHAADHAELLGVADKAMHAAKALGRDRVVIYSPQVTNVLGAQAGRRNIEAQAHLATVLSLAEALDQRDSYTARHSQTVGTLSELMAIELGLDEAKVQRVRLAGILHDIGKIGVPDSILCKPGPLTSAEYHQMKRHPELGARILSSEELADVREWILAHHERPDGTGYPKGISDDEIPLEAAILAVADAYEAMISDRVYRPGRPPEEAQQELRRCTGTQFEPDVVEALLHALREGSTQVMPGWVS